MLVNRSLGSFLYGFLVVGLAEAGGLGFFVDGLLVGVGLALVVVAFGFADVSLGFTVVGFGAAVGLGVVALGFPVVGIGFTVVGLEAAVGFCVDGFGFTVVLASCTTTNKIFTI